MKKIIIALVLLFSSVLVTLAYTQGERNAATFLATK